MATVGTLAMNLIANSTGFTAGINAAARSIDSFRQRASSFAGSIGGQVTAALGVGSAAGFLGWGVKLAADAESAQVAFATMLKSGAEATRVLKDLRAFAASTPFEFPELRGAARSLLAFGVGSGDLMATLRAIGDVSSGIGAPIGEIAELYGKARVQGRLFGEDINQLTGRGIPIIQQLAQQFGVAESGVKKLVEQGQVNFSHLERAFQNMTTGAGQFAGMMATQSQTLSGRWSTLKDDAAALAMTFGESLLPAAGKLLDTVSPLVQWFAQMDATTRTNIVTFGALAAGFAVGVVALGAIVRAVQAVVAAYRAMATASAIAQALSGPKGWAALAAGALVAAGAVAGVAYLFDKTATSAAAASVTAAKAAEKTAKIGASAQQSAKEVDSLAKAFDAAKFSGETSVDRQVAKLDELMRRGEDVAKQFRTPGEVYRDTAAELSELMAVGAISGETFRRAMADAAQQVADARGDMDAIRKGPGGAFDINTVAGFSAVQESLREADAQAAAKALVANELKAPKLEAVAMEQLDEARRQTAAMDAVGDALEGLSTPEIKFLVANF